MADCEVLSMCAFFNDTMQEMTAIASMYKRKYCQGDNADCARHMVRNALGKQYVPADLFPNQQDRARRIIAAG